MDQEVQLQRALLWGEHPLLCNPGELESPGGKQQTGAPNSTVQRRRQELSGPMSCSWLPPARGGFPNHLRGLPHCEGGTGLPPTSCFEDHQRRERRARSVPAPRVLHKPVLTNSP